MPPSKKRPAARPAELPWRDAPPEPAEHAEPPRRTRPRAGVKQSAELLWRDAPPEPAAEHAEPPRRTRARALVKQPAEQPGRDAPPAAALVDSPPPRRTRARAGVRKPAARPARGRRRSALVPTESSLLWGLLYDLVCAPVWLVQLLRGRARPEAGLRPLHRLRHFVLSARMTALLIGLNLLVFAAELYARHAGWSRAAFLAHFALSTDGLVRGEQLPLWTHVFAHVSPMHLFGNMLALFVFGRVVERNLGPWRLLGCYVLAAVCSTALSLMAQALSGRSIPTMGASGAVAGLLALGILLEPLTLTFEALLPMPLFLVGWLSIATDFAALLQKGRGADAIDHPAHLGGYLSVLLCYYALKRQHQRQARLGLLINVATLGLTAGLWFLWPGR